MKHIVVTKTIRVIDGDIELEYDTDKDEIYVWNNGVIQGSFSSDYFDLFADMLNEIRIEKSQGDES